MAELVEVTAAGAVILGPDIVCDGFLYDAAGRVQTHVHTDHLADFTTSKGIQDIYSTHATFDLLVLEYNAELPNRRNMKRLNYDEKRRVGSSHVRLLSSGHMLGAAQVEVELSSGIRVGYSGDFYWPLEDVIHVDILVLDSTYGSSRSVRRYHSHDADRVFLEVLAAKLKRGPVLVKAFRGTLQRALELIDRDTPHHLVGSAKLCREADIYRSYGYAIPEIFQLGTDRANEIEATGKYIRLVETGERISSKHEALNTIMLSAYWTSPDDPLLVFNENSCRIALSDHADFDGTVDYVQATGAQMVITDNARGSHAVELAQELRGRLAIEARPSRNLPLRGWESREEVLHWF